MNKKDSGRVRARLTNGIVTVKALLRHPMETGSRKHPGTGEVLPRQFIQEVVCEHNGKPVLTLDWGWGISADPYLSFDLKEGSVGDVIAIRWVDNLGREDRVEGAIV